MADKHAFSLVEVVLAIGIMAFGLIVIIGLLPMGLKSNRDSAEESQAVNIMQAVIADRQSTDYSLPSAIYAIPAISGSMAISSTTNVCFISESGSVYASGTQVPQDARYRVNYTLYSGTGVLSSGSYPPVIDAYMNIRVSWPAQQTNNPSAVETTAAFMQHE